MLDNERELRERSKNGDSQAFGLIYDHYIRKIYNFIFYKTYNKDTAEDLTSQTFLKALKNIGSIDVERPISSWLYKIAQNTVIDYFRSKKEHRDIDDIWDMDISDESVDIEGGIDSAIEFKRVQKYLAKLKSEERDIIKMRVWQEMSYKEIAEALGKSESSCKMMYSRSIAKLRDIALPLAVIMLLISKI